MNILLFGPTGMVGQGVLRECLRAQDVARVTTIGRQPTGQRDPRLHEIVHADLFDYTDIEAQLRDIDACFFCLGTTSAGTSEADYTRVTCDLTLAAARALVRLNPRMTFVYVSGAGADSSEQGKTMWARVRGKTENALFALPFASVCAFRPGIIEPLHGVRSKTRAYRLFYTLAAPLFPLLRRLMPRSVLTTEMMGEAMLEVARHGAPKKVLEAGDIRDIALHLDGARAHAA